MKNNEQDGISLLSPDEKLIIDAFRQFDRERQEEWLIIADRFAKGAGTATPCLALVNSSVGHDKPQPSKRRKSVPAIPRQISSALKGLESGSLDLVFVNGVVEEGERLFSVSAGIKHELLDILYKPFLSAAMPSVDGNVISFQREPTAIEQINAIGEAFTAGKLSSLNLIIRDAQGRTERKSLK